MFMYICVHFTELDFSLLSFKVRRSYRITIIRILRDSFAIQKSQNIIILSLFLYKGWWLKSRYIDMRVTLMGAYALHIFLIFIRC